MVCFNHTSLAYISLKSIKRNICKRLSDRNNHKFDFGIRLIYQKIDEKIIGEINKECF